jgi:sporulation protein YlmC with PRC-barrel domain
VVEALGAATRRGRGPARPAGTEQEDVTMRAERLKGMAVVDVDAAVKLGTVSDVILDPGARQVAGLIVARGQSLLGGGQHFTLPASAVRALGQDAVTVRRAEAEEQVGHLGGLPRLGQVVGRKVVTENGRLVGTIEDVEIDPLSGAIVAYPVGGRGRGGAGWAPRRGPGRRPARTFARTPTCASGPS